MTSADLVRDAYDAKAEVYASLFLGELANDPQSRRGLAAFAELVGRRTGPVVDLGCGPGSAVAHLAAHGLTAIGIDLSPGQIAQARRAFPDLTFAVGDLTKLGFADSAVGGIVSRHSLIHLPPADLGAVFVEWMRVLQPEAPLFVSFFGSRSAAAHGTPFDHKVVTAYELDPSAVARALEAAGFGDIEVEAIPIPEGGRPFDHVTVLARTPRTTVGGVGQEDGGRGS